SGRLPMSRSMMAVLVVGLVLGTAAGLRAAEAPAPDSAAAEEVVKQLRTLNEAFVRGDLDTIRRLLADDQVAILSYGEVETKAGQLKKLADFKVTEHSLEDIRAVPITPDVVRVTLRLVRKGTYKG